MKRMFLTSSVHAVAHDIAKKVDLSKGNKLVFIITAAEPKMKGDMTWLHNDRQALVDAGFDVEDYTITGKRLEELQSDLFSYDYIYLSGGDTLYLLQESHKSGFFNFIKELVNHHGKVYIGTSAGSIITGPKLPEYFLEDESKEIEGYGFVNFTILPHWGREDFRKKYLKIRLKLAFKDNQVPLLLLTDNQYVIVEDDIFKMVNVVRPY